MIPTNAFFSSSNNCESGSSAPVRPAGQLRLAGREYHQVLLVSATSVAARYMRGMWWHECDNEVGDMSELYMTVSGVYCILAGSVNIPKNYTFRFSIHAVDGRFLAKPIAITWSGSQTIVVTPGMALTKSDNYNTINGLIKKGSRLLFYFDLDAGTSAILGIGVRSGFGNSGYPYMVKSYSYVSAPPLDIYNQYGGQLNITGGINVGIFPVGIQDVICKTQYDYRAAFIAGDSRFATSNDKVTGRSNIWRALYDFGIPIRDHSAGGSTLQAFAGSSQIAYDPIKYCTDFFCNYAINDITNGTTLALLQGYFNTVITKCRAANPLVNIWWVLTEMETDCSNNNWLNPATQTPRGGDATKYGYPNGLQMLWNAWIRTRVGIELIGILDPMVLTEYLGSGQSAKWANVDGVQNLVNNDGIHENDVAATMTAGLFKQQLLSQGFVPNFWRG